MRPFGAARPSRARRRATACRARPRRSGRSRRRARRDRRPGPPRSCSCSGRATSSPMRITCASLERSEPLGSRCSSVSLVTAGRSLAVETQDRRADRRAGQHRGGDRATASRRRPPARPRSAGRARPWRGRAALATPAASAAASAPPTRTVLRVARGREAELLRPPGRRSDLTPSCGGCESSSPRLQPRAAASSEAEDDERRAGARARRSGSCRRGIGARGGDKIDRPYRMIDWSVNRGRRLPTWISGSTTNSSSSSGTAAGSPREVMRPAAESTTAGRACPGRSSRPPASGASTASRRSRRWAPTPTG